MIVKTKAEYYFKMVVGKHPYLFPRDDFLTCSFGKKHLFVSIVWGGGGNTKKPKEQPLIRSLPENGDVSYEAKVTRTTHKPGSLGINGELIHASGRS